MDETPKTTRQFFPTPVPAEQAKPLQVSTEQTRVKIRKGRYEQFAREALAAKGCTLVSINWKKRTVHYLDENGNKAFKAVWGLPRGV